MFRPQLLGDPAGTLDDLAMMLLLVGVTVPEGAMNRWAPLEKCIVGDWAARVHLSASDNLNRVPPRPSIVLAEWGGEGAWDVERRSWL